MADLILRLQDNDNHPAAWPDSVIAELIAVVGLECSSPETAKKGSFRTLRALPVTEIIVALGSAGVFTGLYRVLLKFLDKNGSREVAIERDGAKILIKGHSLPEEEKLLAELLPEFINQMSRDEETQPARDLIVTDQTEIDRPK